jgi:(E)-4-hydroxy-3-methylbut-2-enyl-diphosphate synthase
MIEKSSLLLPRRATRRLSIGGVPVGGGAPISVQSMTKTDTRNVRATVAQIRRLEKAGCEIVRLAVPDEAAVEALGKIRKKVRLPIVADIHFDHRLALACLRLGIDALRLNPGNIGSRAKIRDVVLAAKDRAVPIRIGVNSGSLEKDLLRKYGGATAEAMVESALRHIAILEDLDFRLIKVSLKASDVLRTVEATRSLARRVDYPFHAGITEAGTRLAGAIKSAVGLGLLLNEGLADTVRVSLTAPPEEEVRAAYLILGSLCLRRRGVNVISCPTCGRSEVNLMSIAAAVEKSLAAVAGDLTVAVMGCTVNGPGEAKEADLGVAGGQGVGILFKEGKLLRKVAEKDIADELLKEAEEIVASRDELSARHSTVALNPRASAAEADPRAKPGALTRDANTRLSTAEADPQTKPGAPTAASAAVDPSAKPGARPPSKRRTK